MTGAWVKYVTRPRDLRCNNSYMTGVWAKYVTQCFPALFTCGQWWWLISLSSISDKSDMYSVVRRFVGLPWIWKGHRSSWSALNAKESSIESQQGHLLRFSQLSIFTMLNLIDVKVLIKIRIATFPLLMWCSEHISNENLSPESNCLVYSGPGLHGEQMTTSE